ncbi:MAG: ABC transporter substrate-binding protein [Desulfobacterota bacterium]|nr:ABC transporter substrate-binding protein [Thermodesulfobacteriota bacterium]
MNPLAHFIHHLAPILLILMTVVSCSQKTEGSKIRLGYLQNDLHHLPAFVAIEKGFFSAEGISVQVAGVFKAGPELMSAFGSGSLDLGYVGQAPATAAALNNVADIRFIAQVNLEGSSIVIDKESNAASIADLAGMSVAIPGHATMQDFLLRRAVARNGIGIERLTIIVLKPPEMLQALSQKQIQAFIAWEPYPAQAELNGTGKILMQSKQIWPRHPCCVLITSEKLCREQTDTIAKIRAAHDRACTFINNNPEEAIQIGVSYTGMPRDTVAAALSRIIFTAEIDTRSAEEFVAFLKELRYIQSHAPEKKLAEILYK